MFKSIGSTWLLNVLQILALMKLAPYVVGTLGDSTNGLWVTIVSMTGILSLLILGVPMASVRFITERVAAKDLAGENRAIATCFGIALSLGAGAAVIGLALYFLFDVRYLTGPAGAGFDAATLAGARTAFLIVVAQVALGFAMRLPYAIFDAHDDFVVRNWIMASELLLRFVTTLGLLAWRAELPMLALVQFASMVFEFAVMMVVVRRRYPGVRYALAGFDRALVGRILGFSLFAMLLNVGTLLAFRADAMVIGAFLPAEEATYFDVGNKFFDPLTQFLISVGAVVMPMATRLKTTGELGALRDVFLKWSKICFSLVLLVGLYLLVLGPQFLGAWIGPHFVERSGPVLQVLMLSFLVYLPVRGVALPLLMGLGKPRFPAIALLVMGVVNLIVSLALVKPLGILGVALGTAIPNLFFAAAVLVHAARELDVGVGKWLAYVAGRAVPGALIPLAFLWFLRTALHEPGLPLLVACGAAMVALFAIVWIFFVFRGDPYLDLRALIARRMPGFAGRRGT
ncbi:MAG: polysaccharide biosynthesis protein [Planctomycetes bacterium]|nr:polysaccharide biosynthesis protein [Planctomycetota bacterium]